MKVKLKVVEGKPLGKEFFLPRQQFLIGRGPECHLRPNSDLISRQHCAIAIEGDTVRLKDLGSTNGTLVNGSRVEGEVALQGGDLLQVGTLVFAVEVIPEAAETEAVAARSVGPAPAVDSPHDTLSSMTDETVISRPRTAATPAPSDAPSNSTAPAAVESAEASVPATDSSEEQSAAEASGPPAADEDVLDWLTDKSSGPIATADTRTLSAAEMDGMGMGGPAGKQPDPNAKKTPNEPASKVAGDILRKYLQDGRR